MYEMMRQPRAGMQNSAAPQTVACNREVPSWAITPVHQASVKLQSTVVVKMSTTIIANVDHGGHGANNNVQV